jgi:hypothetical protein
MSTVKREKRVVGSWVAKQILWFLRDWRKRDSGDAWALRHDQTAEIEYWEDLIRGTSKGRRREPRGVLELDSATVAALDEVFLQGRKAYQLDDDLDYRRRFALQMIQAGCEAVVRDGGRQRLTYPDFAIEFRDMTDEEKQVELMARRLGMEE